MALDVDSALRTLKPERRTKQLSPRASGAFVFAGDLPPGRIALLLDTNVYIHNAAGSLPPPAAALLDLSLQFHCSVCLSEIGIGLGGYSPLASGYAATRNHYRALINQIPDHRLLVPDEQIWLESGIVAGMLWRIQGYKPQQRKDCLNDALIYLTATKHGLPVLTENKIDFDLIQQIVSRGSFIYF